MERNTRQKQIILGYLKQTNTHPSAKEVYNAVKIKHPSISRSTVYRTLKCLSEKKQVQDFFHEVNRYDANLVPHAHFVCRECKKIFDVFGKYELPSSQKGNKIRYVAGGKIINGQTENYRIYYYGVCQKCQSK